MPFAGVILVVPSCSHLLPASAHCNSVGMCHEARQQQWQRRAPLWRRLPDAGTTARAAPSGGGPQQEERQPIEERERLQYQRGNCYGCGVRLQTADIEVAGYVEQERYDMKRKHRQLGQLMCHRCQELSNGAMIPGVADFAQQRQEGQQSQGQPPQQVGAAAMALAQQQQQPGEQGRQQGRRQTGFADKVLLTPEELREKLKVVQQQRAVVVLLVDLLDASGSILGKVRELVGSNPIILVGTKVDLLPAGADLAAVAEWLHAAAAFKRINAVSVHLVSSRTGGGVPLAVAAIRRERRGRDVFVMGAANVGKSAFIRALVRDMSSHDSRQFDAMALSRGRYLPVESAMPGTTLELIPMEVFESGGMLYDTPGLHLHHRVPHLLTPTENKQLHPRRRLRAYVPPSPGELLEATKAACSVPLLAHTRPSGAAATAAGRRCHIATYWWGGLVKFQLLSCPPDTELVFYGPQALLVEASVEAADPPAPDGGADPSDASGSGSDGEGGEPTRRRAAVVAAAAGGEAEEPHGFGSASVMRRGGLRPAKMLVLRCAGSGGRQSIADIAVSGIPGWVAVHASGGRGHTVHVRVWTPPGVEVFNRPPLPVPSPLLVEPPGPKAGPADRPANIQERQAAINEPAAAAAAVVQATEWPQAQQAQQQRAGGAVEGWW